jgi:hypothetical protein
VGTAHCTLGNLGEVLLECEFETSREETIEEDNIQIDL